jgi:ABC-type transport system involved in multi-copper enzyme maturation permease subunit
MGSRAVKEIDREPGRYTGRDKAVAGKVMGIIGTVVLVLGIAALVAVFAFAVSSGSSSNY